MSIRFQHAAFPLVTAGLFIFTLSGCESSGSYRVASVGQQGIAGAPAGAAAQGEAGSNGAAGANGSNGSNGSNGATGSGGANGSGGARGLAGVNAVATGGLIGPGGAAGTGLLANTGDPSRRSAGSGVLVASGTAASRLAQRGAPLAQRLDSRTPGGMTITGRVIRTADNAGQTLVQAGNGQQYLVDGLAASPGQLVTVNVRNQRVIGRNGDQPLIAGTATSATTAQQGVTLTAGAANRDHPATISSPVTGTLTPGTTPAPSPTGNVVQRVTGGLPVVPHP